MLAFALLSIFFSFRSLLSSCKISCGLEHGAWKTGCQKQRKKGMSFRYRARSHFPQRDLELVLKEVCILATKVPSMILAVIDGQGYFKTKIFCNS